jgi:nucleotide-binding universal stress UspA family protein
MTNTTLSPTATDAVPLVVVATDFSETAEAALDWGVELAKSHRGRVILVHALHLQGPITDFMPSPPDLEEHMQGAAIERLNRSAARMADHGVPIETRLELGIPSQAIVRAAEEIQPSVIVLGTTGQSAISHLLLGSTAQRVVQHAPCPVLTVHPGDAAAHRPIQTILVPTDFSRNALHAARQAQKVLRPIERGAKLILLHAYHLPIEYTAYGAIPTGLNFHQDVAALAEEKLLKIAEELGRDGLEVETSACQGYPPEAIVAFAEEHHVDLIAIGTHGRTGLSHLLLGSNAERVVQHAPCPVLTVRHKG